MQFLKVFIIKGKKMQIYMMLCGKSDRPLMALCWATQQQLQSSICESVWFRTLTRPHWSVQRNWKYTCDTPQLIHILTFINGNSKFIYTAYFIIHELSVPNTEKREGVKTANLKKNIECRPMWTKIFWVWFWMSTQMERILGQQATFSKEQDNLLTHGWLIIWQ